MEVDSDVVNSTISHIAGCLPTNDSNVSFNAVESVLVPPCIPDNSEKQRLRVILTNVLAGLIAIIMVGIGCAVEVKKILKHLKNPTGILTGMLCQFVIMPLLAYAWAKLFMMDDPETLSLLIVGSCPGGTFSNIVTYWVGGDMELSAVMTTISVSLSFATLPLLLFIYSEVITVSSVLVPYSAMGITIALIVVPISIGAFLRYKSPRKAVKVLRVFSIVGIIALIGVGGFSIYLFNEFWSFQTGQIVAAVCYPVCGMSLGYAIPSIFTVFAPSLRLTARQRRTVSVETGIQNSQLAMSIIQFSGWSLRITGRITVFPLMYAVSQMAWSLVFVGMYQCISYARNGKFPGISSSVQSEENGCPDTTRTAVVDNPAFDPME